MPWGITCIVVPVLGFHLESQSKGLLISKKIKREQSQAPIVEMAKSEVEEKRLGDYVIMPEGVEVILQ